jgi:zinc-binding in reverse transcriptase
MVVVDSYRANIHLVQKITFAVRNLIDTRSSKHSPCLCIILQPGSPILDTFVFLMHLATANESSLSLGSNTGWLLLIEISYDFITCPGVKEQLPHIPWKLRIPSKVKIFLWLLHRNRILTNANLRKNNWPCGATCVLCSMAIEEDADHLFFRCHYARRIWNDKLPANKIAPTMILELPNLLHKMSQGPVNQSRRIATAC